MYVVTTYNNIPKIGRIHIVDSTIYKPHKKVGIFLYTTTTLCKKPQYKYLVFEC